jgi:hypothetical protein
MSNVCWWTTLLFPLLLDFDTPTVSRIWRHHVWRFRATHAKSHPEIRLNFLGKSLYSLYLTSREAPLQLQHRHPEVIEAQYLEHHLAVAPSEIPQLAER